MVKARIPQQHKLQKSHKFLEILQSTTEIHWVQEELMKKFKDFLEYNIKVYTS